MLNSEHLSLVNKIGDKTEFTITRVHCTYDYLSQTSAKIHINFKDPIFGGLGTFWKYGMYVASITKDMHIQMYAPPVCIFNMQVQLLWTALS